ncbi:MAG: RNA methyltransferase [Faecalicoccus sp.]|nr:RNA methyltransferase [Faecalicoccus sp.]
MEKYISSTQNKLIKECAKLHLKKERDKTGHFLVEGWHMVEEAQKAGCIETLFISESEKPIENAVICSDAVMEKLSFQSSGSSIIALCSKPEFNVSKKETVVLLDGVQDPGNVGTIVRTAYSLGVDAIYCSKDCADVYNPKTIQSTQGALFHIPVIYDDLSKVIDDLKENGFTIYATSLYGDYIDLKDIKVKKPYGMIFGSEGNGIRENILKRADVCVRIEMDAFESLNVAVAAGIVIYTLKYC